ncbi:MAG: Glucose/sorbosone dehydrogenase-like protein [Solirubrobacterales bacterium]|jgi:hypothetical protein|nr:Glucose/sorbosone dehydrogenase-like protein [Solirubrobacterales bacterium]
MPFSNWCRSLPLAGLGSLLLAAGAAGAGPPPPTAVNGHPVTTVATGVATPTSFAFDPATGTVFVGAFGNERTGKGGGVLAIVPGRAPALVPGIPSGIAGVVDQGGTLYASASGARTGRILALSGWNGTTFASSKTIFKAATTVGSVNGLAWGPDGRLYAGAGLAVDVNKNGKAKKSPFPHPYTVFSIRPDGGDFKVISRGLRQPWQLTFVGNSPSPYVSVLSQDAGKIPADAIVVARPGANFGFPKCFAGVGLSCKPSFEKPLIKLPRHASPMGIQAVGDTLYVALFGGIRKSGPEVVTIPAKAGAKPTPFLTGFAAPVVAVGISGGALYAGDLTGSVYTVAL